MVDFNNNRQKGESDEKKQASEKQDRGVEDNTHSRGKKKNVSGKHSSSSKCLHGIRGRTRKLEDVERVYEDSEEYSSTTRYIESSLGIKSYSELAPYLAKGVEGVMSTVLTYKSHELIVTSEFICMLHKNAFGEIFPTWAGKYRDRNVTVGKHCPPSYFEIHVLMRQYCDDLESRLSTIGSKPDVGNMLLETLAFSEGRFLSIHPFLDFNGRVIRMLLFSLLYRLDLPPVPLVPDEKNAEDKTDYFNALSSADQLDWQPLITIWKKRLGVKM